MSGITEYGFEWGPITVQRTSEVEFIKGRGKHRALRVSTPYHLLEIYVSPTGRTVRVFENGKGELKP